MHRPRKRFGQNFLQNQLVINQILMALQLKTKDLVVEIGPGLGALTKPLLANLEKLYAVEIDRDLCAHLLAMPEAPHKLHLLEADALEVDYTQFGKDLRLIGNLPYNISTPLLLRLLTFLPHIKDMHFMLQKEVVTRLAATPGNKSFGRLSVMMQYACDVEHVMDVSADAFYPKPKVMSAIVRLTPNPQYAQIDTSKLERLVASAFSMRRKTLANNLKGLMSADDILKTGINPGFRPEQLSVADYVKLTQAWV